MFLCCFATIRIVTNYPRHFCTLNLRSTRIRGGGKALGKHDVVEGEVGLKNSHNNGDSKSHTELGGWDAASEQPFVAIKKPDFCTPATPRYGQPLSSSKRA